MTLISVDIETSCAVSGCAGYGKSSPCDHALDPHRNHIDLIGVAWEGGSRSFTDVDLFSKWLRSTFSYQMVGHNFKWDRKVLITHGVKPELLNWKHDTQLLSVAIQDKIPEAWLETYEAKRRELNKKLPKGQGHRNASPHSLKTLCPYFLNVAPFWEDPTNHNDVGYVLKDAQYTLRLFKYFEEKYRGSAAWTFYEEKLLPWTRDVLHPAEMRGIALDMELLRCSKVEAEENVARLEKELKEIWAPAFDAYKDKQIKEIHARYDEMIKIAAAKKEAKGLLTPQANLRIIKTYTNLLVKALERGVEPLNLASPTQLAWLLKEHLGLDISQIDKDGEESTGAAVLEKLAAQGRDDIKIFLKYREQSKLATAFYPSYEEMQVGGVIHTSFNPSGTRTGRLSSSGPNLQQVPGHLHKLFKARPGYKLICRDASGIEARLIALYTSDPTLYDIVANGGDIHGNNARIFFGLDCDQRDVKGRYPDERKLAKTVGFALFYGAGYRRIKYTALAQGISWSDGECKEKLTRFREDYETAFEFKRSTLDPILDAGEEINNLLGRPMRITNRDDVYMKGFNRLIQSSASDLILHSAWKAQMEYNRVGLGAHVLLLVHDEIVVEAPTSVASECEAILERAMVDYPLTNSLGPVPLAVEGSTDDFWSK